MKQAKKLAVIGAGKMGEAIIAGLLKSGVYEPKDIQAAEVNESRRKYITHTYQVKCIDNIKEVAAFGDIIIIAVKPAVVEKVLAHVGPAAKPGKIFVSIAAGVTLEFLRQHLPSKAPVVRVMPNIAVGVREAMITVCPSENTSQEEANTVTKVLGLQETVYSVQHACDQNPL